MTRSRRRHPRDRPRVHLRRDRWRPPRAPRRSPSSSSRTRCRQDNRTIFEKLREAALAYHLTRKWSKRKILTEYLNSIYFGNGAYGVESAARVYFGKVHGYDSQAGPGAVSCGDSTPTLDLPKCAKVLAPWEAAMLAGMVANPSAFNPFEHPVAAKGRRDLVFKDMFQQGYISQIQYDYGAEPAAALDQRPPAARRAGRRAVLHQLAAATDPAAVGHGVSAEGRRVPRLLRRPEDPDHARSEAPAGGRRRRSRRTSPPVRRADRVAGGDRQQDRTRCGRWSAGRSSATAPGRCTRTTSRTRSTWPRRASASLARHSSRSRLRLPSSRLRAELGVHCRRPLSIVVPNSGGKENFTVRNFGNSYSGTITSRARPTTRTTRCSSGSGGTASAR